MSKNFHNVIFSILIGIILGVTVYLLVQNMPPISKFRYSIELPKKEESKETIRKNSNKTEKMIETGELSDHKAKYYRISD